MANPINETINRVNGGISDFKNKAMKSEDQLEKFSHNTGEKIGAMATEFADSATEYVKTGRSYVKLHPVQGIALAAAVGLVTGSLVTLLLRRK
ncbi:MAG: hypothetical protein ACOYOK_06075 [Pseudobdellovibrionaceae bacterium]